MTLTEQLKILDNKIKVNQAHYHLDKVAANIKKIEKYGYLTGEDLRYKPDVVEQAKIDYSSLGKVLIKD